MSNTNLLSSYLQEANFAAILKELETALGSTPPNDACTRGQLLFNRGWCHQQLAMNRKALKDFNQALELGFGEVKVHLHRGQALWSLEKHEVYSHSFRKVIDRLNLGSKEGLEISC